MAIITGIGILATMALQVGASVFNQKYSNKTIKEIKKRQQEFQSANLQRSIKRDYKKFRDLCDFQLQMEEESHAQRLNDIDKAFDNWLTKASHMQALTTNYPLSISPYIIKSSVIPFCYGQISERRKEVFCILTTSNDKVFNDNIIPLLDDRLCNIISSVWNERSMHSLCYYTNIWRQGILCNSNLIQNIKALIKTPTITVTPYFENRNDGGFALIVQLNMWGDGIDKNVSIETGLEYNQMPTEYSSDDIDSVISKLYPIIICAIAECIDVYYWSNYYQPPLFPSILSRGLVKLDTEKEYCEFGEAYMKLFNILALGVIQPDSGISKSTSQTLKDVASMNQLSFPDRAIGFLEESTKIVSSPQDSERMILNTLSSIYTARTGEEFKSIAEIDVTRLDYDDMTQITRLIGIAKSSNNVELAEQLIDIVRKKLLSW